MIQIKFESNNKIKNLVLKNLIDDSHNNSEYSYRAIRTKCLELASTRYQHCVMVSMICESLLKKYFELLENPSNEELSKKEEKQLISLADHDAFNYVSIMGIIHDMYKLNEKYAKKHGKATALWFRCYIKKSHIPFKKEMKDIYKAIKYHSNKKKLTNNIFYKILCDADILSKFTPQTVYKYRKENEIFHFVTNEEVINEMLEKENYFGKTLFFYDELHSITKLMIQSDRDLKDIGCL